MSKKSKRKKTQKPIRWRPNNIRLWRKAQTKMSQQAVADWLTEHSLPWDRVSVTRLEKGDQMPSIETLEALARLYRTDVDSMLNMTPEEAGDVLEFKALPPTERKRALRAYRVALGE